MADEYTRIVLPEGIPRVTEVRLYAETLDHIAEHAEFRLQLPSQQTALVSAIANPTYVHVSTTDPERSVVLISDKFTHFDDPVHVPVRIIEGTSGRVTTAYFTGSSYSGELLWSADNG